MSEETLHWQHEVPPGGHVVTRLVEPENGDPAYIEVSCYAPGLPEARQWVLTLDPGGQMILDEM